MPRLERHLDRLVPIDRSDLLAVEQDLERATSELHKTASFSDQLSVAAMVWPFSGWAVSAVVAVI